jgi:hypothetical protein
MKKRDKIFFSIIFIILGITLPNYSSIFTLNREEDNQPEMETQEEPRLKEIGLYENKKFKQPDERELRFQNKKYYYYTEFFVGPNLDPEYFFDNYKYQLFWLQGQEQETKLNVSIIDGNGTSYDFTESTHKSFSGKKLKFKSKITLKIGVAVYN